MPRTAAVRSQYEVKGQHEVVLQILSNREVDLSVNAILAEDRRLSDPGQFEKLRSLVCP